MKTIKENILFIIGLTSLTIAVLLFTFYPSLKNGALGASPTGTRTDIASSTKSLSVYPIAAGTELFTAGDCTSRIITTNGEAIWLYFATSSAPDLHGELSVKLGHFQATNTTQVYDSGLYGCMSVRAYSLNNASITVSEFKGWR